MKTAAVSHSITLTPEQHAWLEARVASGEFPSVEAAARHVLDEQRAFDEDDMVWALPLVEEARRSLAEEGPVSLEDHLREIDAHLAKLRRR